MNSEELIRFEEKINNLAKGIAMHLETLQGQIGEKFEQYDKNYTEKFMKIDSLLEEKVVPRVE
ncbi:hypothetical protein [Fredinandcohnia quinoae]|uniref:Uncharacterized protein n=1 Tax=Fredinandcohnia quinoae TaxID=2918902 RepID=A0AAW5DX08_9BACI|nr:hypothetical protein [Fredinandcohnia sp. SECRCQ15]MCH1625187.1 hypothetical protein [Fredinandcohnia sp. SECRCQ15]